MQVAAPWESPGLRARSPKAVSQTLIWREWAMSELVVVSEATRPILCCQARRSAKGVSGCWPLALKKHIPSSAWIPARILLG